MAYPVSGGHPDYSTSNASGSKFIPEIWSTKLIRKFYDVTVLSSITNTEYEGEIKSSGDKVHIRTIPTLTINSYAKGQKLDYETPESEPIVLLIDKGFYWAFAVDRIDKVQADIRLMEMFSQDASEQMKQKIDTVVLQDIYDDVHASNKGLTAGVKSGALNLGVTGTPLALTAVNILDTIVDCGIALDEQNIPEDGRFLVMPPILAGLIKKSDLKDASMTGDPKSPLRNGRIGMIDRFTIYVSNHLATASDGGNTAYNCVFGIPYATTFASQVTETESLKAESTFGDLVRGLQVFGYKVIKPEALGNLYVYKG